MGGGGGGLEGGFLERVWGGVSGLVLGGVVVGACKGDFVEGVVVDDLTCVWECVCLCVYERERAFVRVCVCALDDLMCGG